MSNIFNIKRFCTLVRKECRELPGKCGLSILSMVGGYMIFIILTMLSGVSVSPSKRMAMIVVWTAVTVIFAPSKLHGNVNHSRKGLNYVLLPVSTMEKTLSMFVLNSICTTILILTGLFLADTLLYLIVPSRMTGFLINVETLNQLGRQLFDLFFIQSIFILGNVLFKRQKIAMTFISLIGIFFLLILVFIVVFRIIGFEALEHFTENILADLPREIDNWQVLSNRAFVNTYSHIPFVRNILIISYSIHGAVTAACWIGTYRLIKTTKY
ncbi:MAG: hypothetical protein WCQ69_02255 [Bacteroidales bacterium]|jgi:hypothetical protein|nr:hypothetical protein [Bacteroidales bacterium]MDD2264600.1 hypothetical protein [Bacteroidales bacterium]MDD2831983.1 hypothetical protein [Bacteroidales bacterium]MDD3208986.1 hypothetical protein [Bacteroidales bacterium]MDD3697820.1 hypothetical protein [Bacteroidales bacterium]